MLETRTPWVLALATLLAAGGVVLGQGYPPGEQPPPQQPPAPPPESPPPGPAPGPGNETRGDTAGATSACFQEPFTPGAAPADANATGGDASEDASAEGEGQLVGRFRQSGDAYEGQFVVVRMNTTAGIVEAFWLGEAPRADGNDSFGDASGVEPLFCVVLPQGSPTTPQVDGASFKLDLGAPPGQSRVHIHDTPNAVSVVNVEAVQQDVWIAFPPDAEAQKAPPQEPIGQANQTGANATDGNPTGGNETGTNRTTPSQPKPVKDLFEVTLSGNLTVLLSGFDLQQEDDTPSFLVGDTAQIRVPTEPEPAFPGPAPGVPGDPEAEEVEKTIAVQVVAVEIFAEQAAEPVTIELENITVTNVVLNPQPADEEPAEGGNATPGDGNVTPGGGAPEPTGDGRADIAQVTFNAATDVSGDLIVVNLAADEVNLDSRHDLVVVMDGQELDRAESPEDLAAGTFLVSATDEKVSILAALDTTAGSHEMDVVRVQSAEPEREPEPTMPPQEDVSEEEEPTPLPAPLVVLALAAAAGLVALKRRRTD